MATGPYGTYAYGAVPYGGSGAVTLAATFTGVGSITASLSLASGLAATPRGVGSLTAPLRVVRGMTAALAAQSTFTSGPLFAPVWVRWHLGTFVATMPPYSYEGLFTGRIETLTNLITNPSFEVDTSFWGNRRSVMSRDTSTSQFGGTCVLLEDDGNTGEPELYWDAGGIPVSGGTTYTVSAWVKPEGVGQVWLSIRWDNGPSWSVTISTSGTGWQRVHVTDVVPTDATVMEQFTFIRGQSLTAGYTFRVDGVMLNEGELVDYFDGSVGGASWLGTPHASTSIKPPGPESAVVWRPLELADRSHLWQADETRDPVTVETDTNIVQFVRNDLAVRFNETDVSGIVDGGATAAKDYVFDAGTPWLEVYNTLLAAIGNEPLHANVNGRPVSMPLVDPEQRSAEHDYAYGTTVVPQAEVEAVNPELPNVIRFVARRWDGTTTEGDGIRTVVNDMTGPGSRRARGNRTVLKRVEVDAQTQTELDAQARAQAPFYFAGGGLRYTGQVGLNPAHDDTDVVFLERPPLGISGNWLVTQWSVALGSVSDMAIMDLELERLTGAAFVSQAPVPVGAYGTAMYGSHAYGGPV